MHIGIFTLRDMNLAGGGWLRIVGPTQYLQELRCRVTFFGPTFPSALEGKADFVPVHGQEGSIDPFRRRLLFQASYAPLLRLSRCLPFYRDLPRTLNGRGLDLIHCHSHSSGLLLLRALPKLKMPVAFDVHGIYRLQLPESGSLRERLARHLTLRAEGNLLRNMDALTVGSEAEKGLFKEAYGVSPDKAYVVPIGADIDFLCESVGEDSIRALRKELGLQTERVILFAGAFKPHSGVMDLARAFQILHEKRQDVALVMIGDGSDLMAAVERFAESHGLSRIILIGRQSRERFRTFQQAADVVVVPDIDSDFNRLYAPQKLYDALASGKPAVVTKVPSHLQLVKDNVTGYLASPGNPESLAAAIGKALDDPESFDVGSRARTMVAQEYSWRRVAERVVEVYGGILQRGRVAS